MKVGALEIRRVVPKRCIETIARGDTEKFKRLVRIVQDKVADESHLGEREAQVCQRPGLPAKILPRG